MKKNKNRKKRIGIAAAVLAVVLLTVDILIANYLVSFAIGRTTSGGTAVVPEPSTTQETRDTVDENYEVIAKATEEWRQSIEPETVTFMSEDGLLLSGELAVPNPDSQKWVLIIHGYTSRHDWMWDYGHLYARHGYNVMLPDMRGHGSSEGDYIGMGWPDRLDVLKWIDRITERDPEAEIILYGVSMGGATVMMTSGEDLPANVTAIVEDCGYTSVWDIFSDEMKVLFHLPDFPLLYTADVISQIRAGYGFKEASALKQVAKTRVPILFIHGSEDNFVHTDMVYRVYDACPTRKDIMVVENAGHGQSYYYEPERYEQKVFEFLGE